MTCGLHEEVFTGREGPSAIGWVKGALREARGSVNPQTVLSQFVPGVVNPPMPESIATWIELAREKLQAGSN